MMKDELFKEDWVECELGEILSVSSGKGLTSKKMDGGIYPVYGGNGITGYHSKNIFEEQKLIIGRVGVRCGVTHITKKKSWVTDNALVVSFKSKLLDIKFMKLKLQFENLNKLSNSTAQPVISGAKIYLYSIDFPPLRTQQAIVKKIETLFTSLDSGIADLTKAQEQLTIYRQAVLKKAFEGEYEKVKLEDVSNAMGGFAFKSNTFIKENGKYQVIRIGNVRPGITRYNASPVYVNTVEEKILEKYLLKKNDVIITLTGTRKKRDYGFTTIIQKDNLLLNQRLAYLRFTESILPKFFLYFSWSEPFKEQFFGSETGNVGQGNVGMKSVRQTLVPLLSIQEQTEIVRQIESRLSVCDKVEQTLTESLEKAIALRQSILKKAFEGKLLSAAEIVECKQGKDYEPASVLLEKIRAEKAAKQVKKVLPKKKKKATIAK